MLDKVLALALICVPLGYAVPVPNRNPEPAARTQDPKPAAEKGELKLGEAAPVFRLNDQDGHAVAVGGKSDHWTVLAFYPKAATPG